jgi:hypothetical protein
LAADAFAAEGAAAGAAEASGAGADASAAGAEASAAGAVTAAGAAGAAFLLLAMPKPTARPTASKTAAATTAKATGWLSSSWVDMGFFSENNAFIVSPALICKEFFLMSIKNIFIFFQF